MDVAKGKGKKRPHSGGGGDQSKSGNRSNSDLKKAKKRANQEIKVSSTSSATTPTTGGVIPAEHQQGSSSVAMGTPRHLLVSEAISNREFEIRAMEKALSNATEFTGAMRIFQVVKRYQRRRAASHNVKRLPKYIRARAIHQMAKDPDPPKTMTRRVKRSPARLASFKTKYGVWLETHLWHVKRMKMVEMHGRRIAMQPNQKSARSLYRAACYESVVHDASYEKIVQLEGDLGVMLKCLERICDPSVPSMGAKQYLNGSRAGSIFIHKVNQYPMGSIASVNFLWKQSEDPNKKVLWIWAPLGTEAAVFGAVKQALLYACETEYPIEANDVADFEIGGVSLSLISDMIKFQFFGPRSHAVLAQCLRLASSSSSLSKEVWEKLMKLDSSNILPNGAVLALDIEDPRVHFPIFMEKRVSSTDYESHKDIIPLVKTWPLNVSASSIWSKTGREATVSKRPPMAQIQSRRSGLLPGRSLQFDTENDVAIPILLKHRPSPHGSQSRSDLTHGWDVIFPKGWGQAFLNVCVFAGVRVCGFNNCSAFNLEAGVASFPRDFPESPIQQVEAKAEEKMRMDKYKRTPKGKRFNYELAGWKVPFRPAFESLLPADGRKELFVFHSERIVSLIKAELERKHATFEIFLRETCKSISGLLSTRPFFAELKRVNVKDLAGAMLRVHLDLPDGGKVIANSKIHSSLVNDDDVISQNELIGFTTSGGFSLFRGHSTAIGCCTLKGLYSIFATAVSGFGTVNVRHPNARRSRTCKFEIL